MSYVQNNIRVRRDGGGTTFGAGLGGRRAAADCLTTPLLACFNASAPGGPAPGRLVSCRAVYCVPTGFQLLSVKAKYSLAILS